MPSLAQPLCFGALVPSCRGTLHPTQLLTRYVDTTVCRLLTTGRSDVFLNLNRERLNIPAKTKLEITGMNPMEILYEAQQIGTLIKVTVVN